MIDRRCREALQDWIEKKPWQYFVTLNFNTTSSPTAARAKFRAFDQRLDRKWLGPKYQEYPLRRTLIIAFQEHIYSNFHFHCLLNFRTEVVPGSDEVDHRIGSAWSSVLAGGTAFVIAKPTLERLASYLTKETWRESQYEGFIISTEFF